MNYKLSAAALLSALVAVPAVAAPSTFVPLKRVEQFVGTSNTLYVQTRGNWYQANLAQPCEELPDADSVQIDMSPANGFGAASTIMVDGEQCTVSSVTPVDSPPLELLLNPNG